MTEFIQNLIGNDYIATMIMSLESVFGVITAMIVLSQVPTGRETLGCILMFAAIIVAQLPEKKKI